jgi:hypothetical protein
MKGKAGYSDVESGVDEPLYPHITTSEQGLRWGFIQKARRCCSATAALRRVVGG